MNPTIARRLSPLSLDRAALAAELARQYQTDGPTPPHREVADMIRDPMSKYEIAAKGMPYYNFKEWLDLPLARIVFHHELFEDWRRSVQALSELRFRESPFLGLDVLRPALEWHAARKLEWQKEAEARAAEARAAEALFRLHYNGW